MKLSLEEWLKRSFSLEREGSVLVSFFCCNKLAWIQRREGTQVYDLTVREVRHLNGCARPPFFWRLLAFFGVQRLPAFLVVRV